MGMPALQSLQRALPSAPPPPTLPPVRNVLSLLLAVLILSLFGGVAFFLVSVSGGTEFWRADKKPASETPAE